MPRARQEFDISEIAEMIEEGLSLPAVADELGVTGGQVAKAYYEAELQLDSSLAIKPTGAAIEKARNEGLRWERIAVYSDLPVSEVKALWEERTGEDPKTSYTGRGRRFEGMEGYEAEEKKSATKTNTRRRRKAAEEEEEEEPKATTTRRKRRQTAASDEEEAAPAARRGRRTRAARQTATTNDDEEQETKAAPTRRRRRRNPT